MAKLRAVLDLRALPPDGFAVDPSQCLFMPADEVVDSFVVLPQKGTTDLIVLQDPHHPQASEALGLLLHPDGYVEDIKKVLDAREPEAREWLRGEGFTLVEGAAIDIHSRGLRLWQPTPMMKGIVEALVGNWGGFLGADSGKEALGVAVADSSPSLRPESTTARPRWILDAGAGKGRNAVFLAEELEKAALASSKTEPGVSSGGVTAAIVALEIRKVLVHRASKFFEREGLLPWDTSRKNRRSIAFGATGALESLFDPPVAVKKAPPLIAYDPISADHTTSFDFPRKLGDYDCALFLRFSHNDGLVELSRQLALAGIALKGGAKRPPFVLAVESFHVSSPHPKQREQKLEIGEVMELLKSGEARAAEKEAAGPHAGTGGALPILRELEAAAKRAAGSAITSRWEVISEQVGGIEDGRPTLQGIYRYVFDLRG
jgi:hypothetical protein